MAILIGKDRCNRPLYLWRLKLLHPETTTEERLRKFLFYTLEEGSRRMSPGVEKYTIIADFEGVGLRNININQLKEMAPVIQDCYPEKMYMVISVNINWILKSIWNIIKPFLDKTTVKKVILLLFVVQFFI